VIGESLKLSSHKRQHIDIFVAVIISRESNVLSIRRKPGEGFFSLRGAEPVSQTSLFFNHPNIPGIDETDVGLRHIRISQHPGINLGIQAGKRDEKYKNQTKENHIFFVHPSSFF
jgi:hypothetical protein